MIMTRPFKILSFGLVLLIVSFGGSSENTLSETAAQSAENPIYVTFVIHFDPLFAPGGRVDKQAYERERDNLAWLADFFDQIEREKGPDFVPKLTLEMAGDHAEYYSEDPGGLALLKRLYAKGHSLGIHFHSNYKAGPHYWPDGWSQDTPEMRQRVTSDHINEVDALVAKIIGTTDPTAIRKASHTITGQFLDEALAIVKCVDLTLPYMLTDGGVGKSGKKGRAGGSENCRRQNVFVSWHDLRGVDADIYLARIEHESNK